MVRSDIFFVVCQRWALNGCLFDKWECCEEKIFVGENTSDWAKGGCNERKAYLFVCYLGRVWIDCWKLKTRSWWRDAESLEVSGSSRWPKQTGSPVCHLSACSSPALLGSFNPLPPHLARHITNPLRGLFTWCRRGFPLACSLASWREKTLMVASLAWLGFVWLGLAWPGDNKCYLIRNCLPFHMLFTQPSNIGCLSLSETVYVLIQVFTTYKSTNDSSF